MKKIFLKPLFYLQPIVNYRNISSAGRHRFGISISGSMWFSRQNSSIISLNKALSFSGSINCVKKQLPSAAFSRRDAFGTNTEGKQGVVLNLFKGKKFLKTKPAFFQNTLFLQKKYCYGKTNRMATGNS